MSSLRFALMLLFLVPFGLRGGLEYRLMTGDPSARATGEMTVLVAETNSGNDPAASALPDTLEARIGQLVVPLQRDGSESEMVVEPGATRLGRYLGTLPDDLEGLVAIELAGLDAGRCYVEVVPASSSSEIEVAAQDDPSDPDDDMPIGPRFADNFSFYEPMYFVMGPRVSLNAKFQLGFKYRLISEESRLAEQRPFWERFYLGYTQTSLWDLGADSSPFVDTSYKPGIFYLDQYRGVRLLGLELDSMEGGFHHESNGQGGDRSRSLNQLYIRPTFRYGPADDWHLTIVPKAWVYIGDLSDNPDIADYRGYVDLVLRFGRPDGFEVAATLRKGTGSGYGSMQIDLTYPLDRLFFGNAASYLQFQYYNGWGETLLNYNEKGPSQYRIGFSLHR
jgi:outer membrane phospholipase A